MMLPGKSRPLDILPPPFKNQGSILFYRKIEVS